MEAAFEKPASDTLKPAPNEREAFAQLLRASLDEDRTARAIPMRDALAKVRSTRAIVPARSQGCRFAPKVPQPFYLSSRGGRKARAAVALAHQRRGPECWKLQVVIWRN